MINLMHVKFFYFFKWELHIKVGVEEVPALGLGQLGVVEQKRVGMDEAGFGCESADSSAPFEMETHVVSLSSLLQKNVCEVPQPSVLSSHSNSRYQFIAFA